MAGSPAQGAVQGLPTHTQRWRTGARADMDDTGNQAGAKYQERRQGGHARLTLRK